MRSKHMLHLILSATAHCLQDSLHLPSKANNAAYSSSSIQAIPCTRKAASCSFGKLPTSEHSGPNAIAAFQAVSVLSGPSGTLMTSPQVSVPSGTCSSTAVARVSSDSKHTNSDTIDK